MMEFDQEHLVDDIDKASRAESIATQNSIEARRNMAKPQQVKNKDGSWPHPECIDCDAEIPVARLEATGSLRCVSCQERRERRAMGL